MGTRIRYTSTENPMIKRSMRNFTTADGRTVSVVLNEETKKFSIVDAVDNTIVVEGGQTKNLAVLRIQAKKALMALGVSFVVEERPSRRKVADTGSEGPETASVAVSASAPVE